jgi:hypothetical protein
LPKFDLNNYETVEDRLKVFWKDYPEGRIETEVVHITDDGTCVTIKSAIYKEINDTNPVATGIAQETKGQGGFANADAWMENCETSSIGRALANWKYQGNNKPRPSQEEMKKVQKSKPKQEVDKITEESIKKFEDDIGMKKEEGKNAKQLNSVIAGFGLSEDVVNTYKAQAFKDSKLSKDVESWTNDDIGKFLDLFEKLTQKKTNPVEEVFGIEKETVVPTCPDCKKSEWIEDNREKKQTNPEQFGSIPSWSCSTYKGNQGCGWVAWGDTDCPKEWL